MQNHASTKQAPSVNMIRETVIRVSEYDYDRPRTALVALEHLINDTRANPEARLQIERIMAEVLGSKATAAAKQFICKKLWIMGTDASLPALRKLLEGADSILAEAGCYALRTNESPAAAAALRNALQKASGTSLVAVVNALADKRDALSTARLVELATASDSAVSDAAIAALGKIASKDGTDALGKLHRGADATRRANAAHALLQSGQELEKRGERNAAQDVYRQLSAASEIVVVRRGALLGLQRLA